MVSVRSSIGARGVTRRSNSVSFVNDTTRIVRITAKLLARSARDWMSPAARANRPAAGDDSSADHDRQADSGRGQ